MKKIVFALVLMCACAWAEDGKREYLALPFECLRAAEGEYSLYESGKVQVIGDSYDGAIYVIANVRGRCCFLGEYTDDLPILNVIDAAEWFASVYEWKYVDKIVWLRGTACYAYLGVLSAIVEDYRKGTK